ncbi:MAG: ABC transporter permease [Deltaproteobacteria bacterium]|nr:ABC transporter permease [Deltaproteobacteria bacterium]MBW2390654.1 ABC transporter permease [Deltaproteobacteria bacterium]
MASANDDHGMMPDAGDAESLFGGFGPVFRKETIEIRRDPRLMVFIIAFPVLLLILFGYALRLQLDNVTMAVFDEDHQLPSLLVKDRFHQEGYLIPVEVESLEQMRQWIDDGRARAGLHIPKDFTASLIENQRPTLTLYIDGSLPTIALAMENESGTIQQLDFKQNLYFGDPDEEPKEFAEDPFRLEIETLYNPDLIDVWFFLPAIIGLLIMQVGLILTSTAVVREKEAGTLEQLIVTPVTRLGFVLGKVAPYALIAFVDFNLIVGIGHLIFEVPVAGSDALLLCSALLFIPAIVSLGLVISTFAETQQQAIFLSVFILLPSVLLSGFIFPVEAIPLVIRPLSYLLPLTYFLEIIRGIMIKGIGLTDLLVPFMALVVFTLIFTTTCVIRFQKRLQ